MDRPQSALIYLSAQCAHAHNPQKSNNFTDPMGLAILQAQKILDQIALFSGCQTQIQAAVVMIHYVQQRGESAIVIETALLMSEQATKRRSPICLIR
jgi:hypothetical protein